MVSGFGWDGVNGPCSNHYRAVLGTYSYNGVDSTPTFWSCWTGLTQHQGCLFIRHPMASRLEVGKSLWAQIVRTKQRRYFIIKGDILSHVMLYLAKKKEVKDHGRDLLLRHLSSKVITTHTEALLPRTPPEDKNERINIFIFFASTHSLWLSSLNCLYLDPWVFSSYFLPCPVE